MLARLEHLAKAYEARSKRPAYPGWSSEAQHQDAESAKALRAAIQQLQALTLNRAKVFAQDTIDKYPEVMTQLAADE